MAWVDAHELSEPFLDLRDGGESADALTDELLRELAPGHSLHGRDVRVIARSLETDDVVVVVDDEVALVHLTWTSRKAERPPLPATRVVASAAELEAAHLDD
ncbi:MAG TPA: hypothetical protein VN088_02760 [Nocardioides sp.]|nr:hypothetical protein [Nocardioides sp.]